MLEDVLVRQGIAYQVIGGPRFYERAEIKDLIAYLQVLDNPFDAVSLRADRQPAAPRDRRHDALASSRPTPTRTGISLFEALAYPEEAGVGAAPLKAVSALRTLLVSLQSRGAGADRAAS